MTVSSRTRVGAPRFRFGMDVRLAILPALVALVACGGGGGSGSTGDGGGVVPEPPSPTAGPDPVATPSPTPAGGSNVLLRQGDLVEGDVEVTAIRSAVRGGDGTVFALVTLADRGRARAILRRSPQGVWSRVFDRDSAPADVDLGTLSEPVISDDGAALFRAQRREVGLADRLFLVAGGGFRDLADLPDVDFVGEAAIGPGGNVAFIVGRDCTITDEGSDRCALEAIVADAGSVSPIDLGEIDLSFENPRSPQVHVGPDGAAYFSLRGSRQEPTLVRHREGRVEAMLTADKEVGIGALARPEIEAVNRSEQILLSAALARDQAPRPSLLGVLEAEEFRVVAREGVPDRGGIVTRLDALGFDDSGTILYRATISIGAEGEEETIESLRLGDGEGTTELATQEENFSGTDFDVLEVRDPRINEIGDVAFTVRLGEIQVSETGLRTIVVDGTRVVVRRADGTVSVPLATGGTDFGFFASLEIAHLAHDGDVLVIGEDVEVGQILLRVRAEP